MVVVQAFACGAANALPQHINRELLEELVLQTRLKPAEVKALYARFRRLAPSGFLFPEQFKQTMGVLGLSDDPFIPDRMFRVFDTDQDGKLSFFEFASSLAVMIRGSEDDKLKLSFEMVAGRHGASGIVLEDFHRLVRACDTMMSSLVEPSRHFASHEDATRLFHELASGESSGGENEAVITLESYKRAAQNHDDFLACLGLESHPVRRRGSSPSGTFASGAPGQLQGETGWASEGQRHVIVSAVQLEDLCSRVAALRRATDRHKYEVEEHEVTACVEEEENECCTQVCVCSLLPSWAEAKPPRRTRAAQLQGATIMAPTGWQSTLNQICDELEGLAGWCQRRSEASLQGVAAQGASANAPGWPGLPPSPVSCLNPARWPSGHTVHTTVESLPSREIPTETVSRPNVHAPGVVGRPSHSKGIALAGLACTSPKNHSANHPSRQKRRHRLLGPKKGLAVHFGHENWNMVLSMMIGIRMSIGRSKGEIHRELQSVDFVMKEKFTIIPRLTNIFDSAISKRVTLTRFMDYAPLVFQRIRSTFGIVDDDYLCSVGPDQLLGNMVLGNLSSLSELSSEGKSGAFFYYTADGKYMMKTVTQKEHRLLKHMLKRYYDHITRNPGTLIVRFLGLHSLRVHKESKAGLCTKSLRHSSRKLYFVVMGNMFNTPYDIHRRYDLKGSWVGRTTPSDRFDPSVALKDVDFQQANETIRVGDERRAKLVAQIESDSAFLRDNSIIDYSLLLGIYELGAKSTPTTAVAEDGASDMASERMAMGQPLPDNAALCYAPKQSAKADQALQRGFSLVSLDTGLAMGLVPGSAAAGPEETEVPLHQRNEGGLLSSDRKSLYFFGIIDILTPYDSAKKLEHHFKALRYNRRGVSCCPPGQYAERFNEFLRRAFV